MNKRIILTGLIIGSFVLISFQSSCTSGQKENTVTKQDQIERGKYLVRLGGCNDCHSPKVFTPKGPVPDETRLLSGHPAGSKLPDIDFSLIGPDKWILFTSDLTATVGPWGVTFGVNLTPDEETGIGLWTEEIFIKAMRTGEHLGVGPPILPPMPWFNLAHLTDEDLKAIFAYLKSLKPIKNSVPAPISLSELKNR
jgi:hypothetical protein